ncbi:MAG: hypothetical protein ACI4LX_12200 [Treponema sp.]
MKSVFYKITFLLILFLCSHSYSQENVSLQETPETVLSEKVLNEGESAQEEFAVQKTLSESYIDSSSQLHLYYFKDEDENQEFFCVNKNALDSKKVLTFYSGNKIRRCYYGSDFLPVCVELWKCGKKASDAFIQKICYYEYDLENKTQFSRIKREYDLTGKKMQEIFYDDKNNIVLKKEYGFINREESALIHKAEYKKNARLNYVYSYKFDSAGRIVFEEENHYLYKNDESFKVQKTSSRKNLYSYVGADSLPIITFYEDNILRMKTVYSSQKNYMQYIYFDNDVMLKIQYINDKRRSETFYAGQEEKLTTVYE